MDIVLWIIQFALAGTYVIAGIPAAFLTTNAHEQLPWARRHSASFIRFVGNVELLGALGLVPPMLTGILPGLTVLAALGLMLPQVLAIFVETLPAKEYKSLPLNIGLLVLAAIVVIGRYPLLLPS